MRQRRRSWEVIVVGAGAAGLAATEALGRAGFSVLLLEARDRIGGRIHTRRDPVFPVSVELGAEFVHGRPAITLRGFRQANIGLLQVPAAHGLFLDGQLQVVDFFQTLRPMLERLPDPTAPDEPFSVFMEQVLKGNTLASTQALARIVAEGFEAADPEQLSVQALAKDWRLIGEAAEDYPQFRPLGGYDRLLKALYRRIDPARVQVRLQTLVTEVRWEPGQVEVQAQQFGKKRTFRARALILTVPLPLLRGDGDPTLHFQPPLPESWRKALQQLGMGAVVRVHLCFREPFWERNATFRDLAFVYAPDERFMTVWHPLPLRAPVLMVWAGGPAARQLRNWPAAEVFQEALRTVRRIYGLRDPARYLVGACLYDWQQDPLAQGAYSYVHPGGLMARQVLGRPIENTIFLAGEAIDTQEPATVAGALQSGYRAARSVLRLLRQDAVRLNEAGSRAQDLGSMLST